MDANKPRRLWIVTELYYPEMTSTGYYLTKIAEGLAPEFEVHVLCGQPNYSSRGTRAPASEEHNGVDIRRVWGTRFDKNRLPLRVLNMLTLGASVFFTALTRFRRGDRVLVVTTPPTMPFIVALASLARGAAYTLLIHDVYPDMVVAVGKTAPDSLFVRIANFANRWLYKHASRLIVVGRDMFELISQRTQGLDPSIVVIPNWAELESVRPAERKSNLLLEKAGLSDKFVFLYAGNMGIPNDIESILDAARIVESDPQLHFVFLGDGAKRNMIAERAARSSNITLLEPMPRSEQIVFLNACDVGIVTLVHGMLGVSMPSRTYNLLAAGKPILSIADAGSEIERVVNEVGCGWSVEPGDPENLAARIRQIADAGEDVLRTMGGAARKSAVSDYSEERAVERYKAALSSN